ncbi:hypothetical protein, partial [Paramuribaculum intestinale]
EAGKGGCALYFSLNERAVQKNNSEYLVVCIVGCHIALSGLQTADDAGGLITWITPFGQTTE